MLRPSDTLHQLIGGTINDKRRYEQDKARVMKAAEEIKSILACRNLNVITVESLTAGMICSTLIDVPQNGSVVYGCLGTYDPDAKRQMVSVSTTNLYNHETASQMAYGALCNTRAMTSIAVTGHAAPHPDYRADIGIVWIGAAIRGVDGIYVYNKKIDIRDDGLSRIFEVWANCQSKIDDKWVYAPSDLTAYVSDLVRINTTYYSYMFLKDSIELYEKKFGTIYGKLPYCRYDDIYRPSSILRSNLKEVSSEMDYSSISTTVSCLKQEIRRFNITEI